MSTTTPAWISAEDVKQAVTLTFGAHAQVNDWSVAPAENQGFTALILRVTVNVTTQQGLKMCTSWIAKVEPQVPDQLSKVRDDFLLTRESEFFSIAVPLLQKRCSDLPVVECLIAKPNLILLEDLSDYERVLTLELSHANLFMKKLAQLHAASIDLDWQTILPHIKTDIVFESKGQAFLSSFKLACDAYVKVIKKYYPNLDEKYSRWLSSFDLFNTVFKYLKTDLNNFNVLTHGDCWMTNILFKFNGNVLEDLKFIDFPGTRFVPPSRDIQYLLYTCTNYKFRSEFETGLLQTYVTNFNVALGYERLNFKDFLQEYESSRLYGVCMALVFRTFNLLNEFSSYNNQIIMTNEKFKTISNEGWNGIIERCQIDLNFKLEIHKILEEFIKVADYFGI